MRSVFNFTKVAALGTSLWNVFHLVQSALDSTVASVASFASETDLDP